MRKFKTYGLCGIAATALLVAGCGGGGSNARVAAPSSTPSDMSIELPDGHGVAAGDYMITAGSTMKVAGVRFSCPAGDDNCGVTVMADGTAKYSGGKPSAALIMAIKLPAGHGIAEAEATHMVAAGETLKIAGVRFSCPTGGEACNIQVTTDGRFDVEYSGSVPTVMKLDAIGKQAFENLSKALLNKADLDTKTNGSQSVFNDLRMNEYHDKPDVEEMDNGGGVTTSLTTHEVPGNLGDADYSTGVSDMMVSVIPVVVRAMASDASKDDISVADGDTTNDEDLTDTITDVTMYDQVRDDDGMVENPVLVDATGEITTERTADFDVKATWERNPAAAWDADKRSGGTPMKDGRWTYVFDSPEEGQELPGGRTLHVDLRSDFNPNYMTMGTSLIIATGPNYSSGNVAEPSPADWDDIRFDKIDDVAQDRERDLTTGETGLSGSYMGIKGVFRCVDGQSGNDAGAGICRINQHASGEMGVSEGDSVVFVPYMYEDDADWLAAGVWLTIPEDETGDYAVGAFVYGNDPYKPADVSAARSITGTASYNGQAFGRYAEMDGEHTETGRFTANAMLTADFGNDTDDDIGTIRGNLTDFLANRQEEKWSVNFEAADIMMGMTDGLTPEVIDNSALRFNAGASGHARGHGLTGYWNGQFYGSPAAAAEGDALQPGSAAGTFGLTTERDDKDSYSLTMGGAFAADKKK